MNEADSWKKEVNKEMCQKSTMENKIRQRSMKNKEKNAVSKAMSWKAEEALAELSAQMGYLG